MCFMNLKQILMAMSAASVMGLLGLSANPAYAQQSQPPQPDDPGTAVDAGIESPPPPLDRGSRLPVVIVPEPGVDVLPTPTLGSGLGIPDGLKTPPEILFPSLGYGSPVAFPLTPRTCFEVACKCYANGKYVDAMAFANHGLSLCNHARIYLLKAMCEMNLGRVEDATSTIARYRVAASRPRESIGLREAQERLNGPTLVRIEILITGWREKE